MIGKLLHIEKIKTINYPSFKTIVILHFILFLLVVLIASNLRINIQGLAIERIFQFPHIWNTFAWVASWFNLLLGILSIVLVTNEFQYKTFRKQLIDGLSRNELLHSKLMIFVILAAYTMLLVFISGFIFGMVKSPYFSFSDFIEGLPFLPVLFIQSLGYMLLALLFSLIFKNTAISIVTYILYFFPIEPILRAIIPDVATKFMPVKIISNLTPMPDFVGISLGDMIQINGEPGVSLEGMGMMTESMPLIYSSLIACGYSLAFVILSRFLLRRINF